MFPVPVKLFAVRYMLPPAPPPGPYVADVVPFPPFAFIVPVMFIVPVAFIIISPPPAPPSIPAFPPPAPPLPICVGCVMLS